MKIRFEAVCADIYRLKVPFENIYTAVFLIKEGGGWMLCDCATTEQDVHEYIIPALDSMDIALCDITHILITHPHADHAGGLRYLLHHMPSVHVCAGSDYIKKRLAPEHFILLCDGMKLSENMTAHSLKGHCGDMFGFYDKRSGTLISGDALQICGVGRYGCGLGNFDDYLNTLERVRTMKPHRLVSSHDYFPLGSCAEGDGEICEYIRECGEYARYIMRVCDEYMASGIFDEKVITDAVREKNRTADPDIPPLQYSTVKSYILWKTK